jgi:predicted nucleic acid-binding protein
MVALIDASVLIAAERGQLRWDEVNRKGIDATALAAITMSELLHGVHRAKSAADRAKREAFVERILASMPVLPFDSTIARVHARVWASLARRGTVVGAHDLLVAATALAAGHCVATRDKKDFGKIPGVKVVNW